MQAAPDLNGKVAIVTGSARRTGRVIAHKLAQAGASVVINARSAKAEAEAVAKEIEDAHGKGRAIAHLANVSDPAAVDALIANSISTYGRLDILINNASVRRFSELATYKLEDWHDILHTTLDGTFLCSRAAAPHMANKEGSIINIGGVSAHTGARNAAAMITAKAGLLGLTRALAHELGPMGITVNCVAPASMRAPDDDPAKVAQLNSLYGHDKVPLGRSGTMDEVSEAVVSLCGPAWRYMTGQVIHINGGIFFGN
ncbi:MAG: SDR family NAD(P)-dependent oxidoreductase [Burkholderiales bacterium]